MLGVLGGAQSALDLFKAECNTSQCGGFSGSPGNSQKEGQEDQGVIEELGGTPLAALRSPGPPGLPSGSSLGSLRIHHTGLCCTLLLEGEQ